MDTTNNRPVGPIMGLIIILLIIIAGGAYFWFSRTNTNPPTNNEPVEKTQETSSEVKEIESQDTSDETTAIDNDLNAFGEAEINSIGNDL